MLKGKDLTLPFRAKIKIIENVMKTYDQIEIPVEHSFVDGAYIRKITIPKGTLLVSRYHKHEQLDVMLSGSMTVVSENGITNIKAPYMNISKCGMKRVGYAHDDVVWVDIHRTKETDIKKLEENLYTDDFDEMEKIDLERCRKDYALVLKEFNISHETAKIETLNENDQISIKLDRVEIAPSKIEGMGIFSTLIFQKGDIVGQARIHGKRTQLGRYTNHSDLPNSIMILKDNGNMDLVAMRTIFKEEITIDYRKSLELSGRRICQA